MIDLLRAFEPPPGPDSHCSLAVHPLITLLPQDRKSEAYFFLHYPCEFRYKYEAVQTPGGSEVFKTSDFGQALDWILERWNKLDEELGDG